MCLVAYRDDLRSLAPKLTGVILQLQRGELLGLTELLDRVRLGQGQQNVQMSGAAGHNANLASHPLEFKDERGPDDRPLINMQHNWCSFQMTAHMASKPFVLHLRRSLVIITC